MERSGQMTSKLLIESVICIIIMQLYYCSLGVPSPPQNVKVTKVIKNSVNLEWSPPVSDGGSKIRRYQIWKRVEMTDDWVKVTNIEQYKTNYTISDLEFDVTFMFGVTAENDVGVSERCDIETSVKMEKPSGM